MGHTAWHRSTRTAPGVVFRPNAAFKAPQCPQGHELLICICPIGAQCCDSCTKRIESTYTHRCRQCDYDLCTKCFSAPHVKTAAVGGSADVTPSLAAPAPASLPLP